MAIPSQPGLCLARALQHNRLRKLLAPLESMLRPLLLRRGKILFGHLRGYRFPHGARGTLLGTYESEVQEILLRRLRSADVFYDIGAHHGYFTLFASHLVADGGAVLAFEPMPANQKRLREVVEINELANVTLFDVAVSDHCGPGELYVGDGENDYRPSLFPWKGEERVEIETTTLDLVAEDHPAPDLMKIDVEGAELRVLQGARGLLEGPEPPAMVIEVHGPEVAESVVELLGRYDYTLRTFGSDPDRPYPHHVLALPRGSA